MTDLVYILAASHSGSTLLTLLLNSHPDVATVGELAPGHMEDLAFYRCSCGQLLRECPFWAHIAQRMNQQGLPFALNNFGTRFAVPKSRLATRLLRPLHRGPALEFVRDAALNLLTPWPRHRREAQRANLALIQAVLDYYHARVFVDKGNTALRLKYLLAAPGLNVKVIHLVRDGRAVALTYMDPARYADAQDPSLRGGGNGGDRAAERLPMAAAAREWRRCIQEAGHALARLDPARWIRIRYEDLCSDPDATLARLFNFLGLDPARRSPDFRTSEHHILGNGMRLDAASQIRLDDRWNTVLLPSDLVTFELVAGDTARRYGYAQTQSA